MSTKLCLSTTALLLLLAWSCPDLTAAVTTRAVQEDTPSENRFNFFDAEILQSVAKTNAGNIVVSPIGIKTLLGMILEGAGGSSARQIRTSLRLPERQDAIRRVFLNYIEQIKTPTDGIKLEMGSSVFMAKQLTQSHGYATSLNYYDARLVKVDFSNQELAARRINSWVRDITRGLIPKLIEPDSLHPDAQAVLSNALYFKGRWKIPFEQEATKVKCFYTTPGVCYNTNMMDTLEFFKFNYIQELNADALELPYQGEKFSMLLLAPKEIDGIGLLQRDLSNFPVHSIVDALETTEVLVSLPRFEIDFSTDLVPNLQGLGIQDIFGPNSNLSGMFERNENTVQVSNVFQKGKIIVNEAGSEAAAGTGALVIPLMGSTVSKFRADRPFLFFIRDTTKGITLFAGRVSVPEAATAHPEYQRPRPQTTTPSDRGENSEDGTYGIFSTTSKPSHSVANGQNNRPATTRRPTPRPVHSAGSQARPTGTSNNEGMHNSFNHNNTTLGNSQNSSILFINTDTQNNVQQPTAQHINTQSSLSQQERRPSSPNLNYPQEEVQNTEKQFAQASHSQRNPQIIPQQQANPQVPSYLQALTYRPVSHIHPSVQAPLQPPSNSQDWATLNRNIQLQNIDRQHNTRVSNYQGLQPPSETQEYYSTQIVKQPYNTQFQSGNQPSYSVPNIAGNPGGYSTNYRESQQASSQQSQLGVRNDYSPPAQSYETTARQSQSHDQGQIIFNNERSAHTGNF